MILRKYSCVFFTIFCILSISTIAQEDVIQLFHPAVFGTSGRGPVEFSHGKHMSSFDCMQCHHIYTDGKNIIDINKLYEGNRDMRCDSCHGTAGIRFNLEEAFHAQCIGCHREQRKADNKNAPFLCAHCHPEKRQK